MPIDHNILFQGMQTPRSALEYASIASNTRGQDLQNQESAMRLRDIERERDQQERLRRAMVVGPDGKIDRETTRKNLAGVADPTLLTKMEAQWADQDAKIMKSKAETLEAVEKMDENMRKRLDWENSHIHKAAMFVNSVSEDKRSEAWDAAVDRLGQIFKQTGQDPSSVLQLKGKYSQDLLNEVIMESESNAEALERIKASNAVRQPQGEIAKFEASVKAGLVPPEQVAAYRKKLQNTGDSGSMGVASTISNDTLDMLAESYLATGQLPSMGLGRKGAEFKMSIIERATAKAKARGMIMDPAAAGASYKADSASLAALQKNRDNLITFEKTALANLDQFLSLAKKMPDSGSAWLNKPVRLLAQGAFGSQAQAAAQTALTVVRPEFAKINQGALTGVLSDSARQEVEHTMPDNATLGQFMAAASVLKQDAANRHKFFDQGIDEIKSRIGVRKSGGATHDGTQTTKVNPANGKTYYLHPDGKYYLQPAK